MKSITKFITEKYLIDNSVKTEATGSINDLANLLKDTILKNTKLSEDDFEEYEKGMFNLCNVPQDGKLADDFYARAQYEIATNLKFKISSTIKRVEIVLSKSKPIFIQINLDDTTSTTRRNMKWEKGDIISIDMSEEIKDLLLN